MTTEFTNYVVRTKYEVHGAPDAARKVDEVGRAADRSARSTGGLKAALMGAFGMAGGVGAIMLAKRSLIDFNATLEGNKSTMAGLLMMNTGGTWVKNQEKSNALVDRFLVRAKETSASMADLALMGQWVTASVTAAGGSMKTLENITVGAAVAGKALGRETGDAGREISQMIGGRIESVDVFAKQLVRSIGYADYQKFNKLKESERLRLTEQALDQPALREMAKAQANSYAGVMAAFQDNLQITLGKVGLPLMKEITEEVKRWNSWIDKHPEKIAEMVRDVGAALKSGFGAVKSAVTWIADNKDVLLSLAKAALLMKGGSLIGDAVGGPFRALAGLHEGMTKAGNSAKGFAGAMTSAAGRLAQIGNIVGLVGAGASLGASALLRQRDRQVADRDNVQGDFAYWQRVAMGGAATPSGRAASSRVQDALRSGLLFKKDGGGYGVNQAKLALGAGRQDSFTLAQQSGFGAFYKKSQEELIVEVQLLRHATETAWKGSMEVALMKGWMATAELFAAQLDHLTKAATQGGALKSAPTNIRVDRVVVPAKDPDRWIQDLNREVHRKARTPTTAKRALRGGGALG